MPGMTAEELDAQLRSVYPDDRLPGIGLDRNALGETGRYRLLDELPPIPVRPPRPKDGKCRVCGARIVGRPPTASTCIPHRKFTGRPDRNELLALIDEHKAVIKSLRAAVRAMDREASA